MPNQRKHIQVRGIVQGVGFRPFVYNLAHSLGLTGFVFNSSSGVTIEIEGDGAAVDAFLQTLKDDPPQLAEITQITVSEMAVEGSAGFSILGSREEAGEFVLVSPDAGTCDACWSDFGDPANRRYGYPFTNCTHCGPRYTILRDIPMTGQRQRCRPLPCALTARRNMRILETGAFMPNRMPARFADRRCCR